MRLLLRSFISPLVLCLACSPPESDSAELPGGGSNSTPGSPETGDGNGGPGGGALPNDGIVMDDEGEQQGIPEGCGNGMLVESEVCDDGNQESGDGCAANCGQLEPGFSCAEPGKPCLPVARCGDGVVAVSEQCDDANMESGDGCSERCRVELGSKCEGTPSVCTATTCGDGIKEGAEACDDGNALPFDGCSSLCLREPNCEGLSCTSECGDGLVINEECDDGNQISGDGCSAECAVEGGFTCERATACEMLNEECVLRVAAIFRDFDASHPDFGAHDCSDLAQGALEPELSATGKPVMGGAAVTPDPCLSSPASFSDWYSDAGELHVGELVLFDNGRGGFVNRFDNDGTFFTATTGDLTYPGGATLAACEMSCRAWVSNEEFNAGCGNFCGPLTQEAQQAPQRVQDAQRALDDAIRLFDMGDGVVPPEVAAAQTALEEAMAAAAAAEEAAATCLADCAEELDAKTAECAATCKPCSGGGGFCTFGEIVEYEGSPLFFPVDSLSNDLGACSQANNAECARIPEQYGYAGWPWEYQVFDDARERNFYFTSDVQYWFQYSADMNATLDFTGDDDVWVFINGKLAVDIGGIHVPVNGSVVIDAAQGTLTTTVAAPNELADPVPMTTTFTAAEFGLDVGGVYKINVFHAERQKEGSSFKLTLSGFEAAPSECSAVCGDGILSFGEECDDGVNDGGYGECAEECKLGPFCGDGIVQGEEECDNGPGGGEGCPNCRKAAEIK